MQSFVVHYQEIALKGKNRPWFMGRLVGNLRRATADLDVAAVRALMGRIEVVLGPRAIPGEVGERISRTFGIANYSWAGRVPLAGEGAEALVRVADAILADLGDRACRSFRVSARRADKRFPLTSPQIEREIGGRIKAARGWHVDLDRPELVIHVETLTSEAFYFFGKERGPGGLPTGTSGRVVCLLSGGIDSPVAAWRIMKRGCACTFVHFHSYPILSHASIDKARQLVELLTRYQLRSRLYLVPFGDIQQQVLLTVPAPMRVVVYRRLMLRIAERIAEDRGAQALVTGDVVGQVASQTLENLAVVGRAATLPIFRPLIGMDKEEVTAEAQRLGTYPISIIPDQDCCTLFTPRNPLTRARLAEVEAAERMLPVDDLIARAAAAAAVEDVEFPVIGSIVREPARTGKGDSPMVYQSVKELTDALKPVATVTTDRVAVSKEAPPELVDSLAHTAVFGTDPEVRGTARWVIQSLAQAAGLRFASIHDLYLAMGRGEAGGFTVPAINVRAMAYDTGRAVMRAAKRLNAGAFILEIARSEIGYTEQRPHEYAAVMLAAALREGFSGFLFLQGDHVQTNAKKYNSPEREKELETLRALIKEEIAAGFYNIDIDTSTLVDLTQPTLDEQQRVNCELAAEFTEFIRRNEPSSVTVSVGGEIGEVGGKNSDVHELHAFMKGYNAALRRRGPDLAGISKISVQTGTAHGGFIDAGGKLLTDVKIDLDTLRELSRVAREEYGLGGAVQHGASTLPADAFDAFPRVGACEIHLATNFQNMVYDGIPSGLREEMYAWTREHAAEERKPKDTEEQFIYKARKKAIGPFKKQLWNLPWGVRDQVGRALEDQFAFLMTKLKVGDTTAVVRKFVKAPDMTLDRDAAIVAAGGKITAAERKAEGLAD
jgi:tRNA sulfurtransferase ThiI